MAMYGINYKGLHKRKNYEQLFDYLQNNQDMIRYPDRFAKQMRNHPYLTQFDSEEFGYMDTQQKEIKKQDAMTSTIQDQAAQPNAPSTTDLLARQPPRPPPRNGAGSLPPPTGSGSQGSRLLREMPIYPSQVPREISASERIGLSNQIGNILQRFQRPGFSVPRAYGRPIPMNIPDSGTQSERSMNSRPRTDSHPGTPRSMTQGTDDFISDMDSHMSNMDYLIGDTLQLISEEDRGTLEYGLPSHVGFAEAQMPSAAAAVFTQGTQDQREPVMRTKDYDLNEPKDEEIKAFVAFQGKPYKLTEDAIKKIKKVLKNASVSNKEVKATNPFEYGPVNLKPYEKTKISSIQDDRDNNYNERKNRWKGVDIPILQAHLFKLAPELKLSADDMMKKKVIVDKYFEIYLQKNKEYLDKLTSLEPVATSVSKIETKIKASSGATGSRDETRGRTLTSKPSKQRDKPPDQFESAI